MSSPASLHSDAKLIALARGGDRSAWQILVKRHDRLLANVCRSHRLSESDAADVKQTTWLRALEHVDRVHAPARFPGWLAAVARHECLRLLRRSARERPCDDELLARQVDVEARPERGLLERERANAVRGAVTALPARERRLLRLLYAERERSYSDISRELAMPVGSIGPTRGRALARARSHARVAELVAA